MERKINDELIEKLRRREVIIKHDSIGYRKDLATILECAFPDDNVALAGTSDYYAKYGKETWAGFNQREVDEQFSDIEIVLVSDFFSIENTEVNNYEIF